MLGMPDTSILSEKTKFSYQTFGAHLGTVTQTRNSEDGRYLFSVGSDGILFVYRLEETKPVDKKRKQNITPNSMADDSQSLPKTQSVTNENTIAADSADDLQNDRAQMGGKNVKGV